MKYCFSIDQITQAGIPIDVAFLIASLYFDTYITKETVKKAYALGLIRYDTYDQNSGEYTFSIAREGIEKVEEIFLNSEFKDNIKEDKYDILADKMRLLFPEGKKPGTHYMWRDSKSIIAKRLRALVKKYDITLDIDNVLKATKKYVESFNGDYQYMQLLKYFIMKKNTEGEETSQLLSYLENSDGVDVDNDSWRDEIR